MIYLVLLVFLPIIYSDAVCDKKTLVAEIKQDLRDNKYLDCRRVNPIPHKVEETEIEKNYRLAAQWDSDCSFEGSDNWKNDMAKYLGTSTLVNVNGDVMEEDDDEQADMCEIIRALLADGKFKDAGEI